MIVYKITNTVNGKAYIGITTGSLRTRFTQHRRDARVGGRYPLHRAMRKYGAAAFVIEELLRCERLDELNAAECAQIALHGTHSPRGYNVTVGGRGTVGRRTTLAARRAKSEQLKRVHAADPTIRARISTSLKALYQARPPKGRKHTPESIARIRAKAVARYATPDSRAQLFEMGARSGRAPRTEKQRANILRVTHDPGVRARGRATRAARMRDPASREAWLQKLRAAQLAAWQRRRDAAPDGKAPQVGNHANAVRNTRGQFAQKATK